MGQETKLAGFLLLLSPLHGVRAASVAYCMLVSRTPAWLQPGQKVLVRSAQEKQATEVPTSFWVAGRHRIKQMFVKCWERKFHNEGYNS